MSNPLISVIIPCYNQGRFIDEAVNSVLNQTFQDFEIIIVNDGSDDEYTSEKLTNYIKSKTRVIHTDNKGLSAARNSGFNEARGEFVQYLDADDTILPSKFEEQLEIFNHDPSVDICFSDYRIYDIDKKTFLNHSSCDFPGDDRIWDFLFTWERGWNIPIHCALFKRKVWDDNMPFNEKLKAKEDWLMWCELAVRNKNFRFLDKQYAIYRYHSSNMTKNITEMHYTFFLAAYYIMQIIPDKYKDEFLKQTIVHINSSMERNIFPELTNQIIDLKNRFSEMDKTIDYRVGHFLLKPYRFIKTRIFRKQYLLGS
jgi:O-antigen biosynthesis protein